MQKGVLQNLTIFKADFKDRLSLSKLQGSHTGINSAETRQSITMQISIYSASPSSSTIPLYFYVAGCQFKELLSAYCTPGTSSAVPTQMVLGGLDSFLR